jgi:hypothetical protein
VGGCEGRPAGSARRGGLGAGVCEGAEPIARASSESGRAETRTGGGPRLGRGGRQCSRAPPPRADPSRRPATVLAAARALGPGGASRALCGRPRAEPLLLLLPPPGPPCPRAPPGRGAPPCAAAPPPGPRQPPRRRQNIETRGPPEPPAPLNPTAWSRPPPRSGWARASRAPSAAGRGPGRCSCRRRQGVGGRIRSQGSGGVGAARGLASPAPPRLCRPRRHGAHGSPGRACTRCKRHGILGAKTATPLLAYSPRRARESRPARPEGAPRLRPPTRVHACTAGSGVGGRRVLRRRAGGLGPDRSATPTRRGRVRVGVAGPGPEQ